MSFLEINHIVTLFLLHEAEVDYFLMCLYFDDVFIVLQRLRFDQHSFISRRIKFRRNGGCKCIGSCFKVVLRLELT